jgi:hypothetical protein
VAAYVLDLRTRRGIGAGSPILGADQIVRFQTWASTVASHADVVVLASPVPLAFVDVSALTEALKAIKLAGEVAGYVGGFPGAGAVLGGIFGGGAGAFLGWEAGSWLQSKVDEIEEVDGRITEPDLADQWSDPLNQSDLGVVLDTLFGLANDAARPKAVIVISGDVHLGAIHEIRSSAAVGAHSRHQVLYQFTSSPIGAAPAADLLGPLTAADLAGISNPNDWFNLCTTPIATYSARIVGGVGGLLATRNFGTLVINPKTSANTVDVRASIRSAGPRVPPFLTDTLEMSLTYDLTAVNPPRPTFPVITPVRRRQ